MTVVMVILGAGLLWLALQGLKRLPMVLTLSPDIHARIRSVLPAVSLTAWLLFVVWAVHTLAPPDAYGGMVMVVVLSMFLLLFGWFVLRDLVAGVVFSARHPALQGVRIQAAGYGGRVTRRGLLGIHLRAEGGETIYLPYTTLAGEAVAEHPPERIADEFRLRVAIPGDINGDEEADALRNQLLLSPWINAERPPRVKVSGSGDERVADIVFHCLSEEHALHVEEYLRQVHQPRST